MDHCNTEIAFWGEDPGQAAYIHSAPVTAEIAVFGNWHKVNNLTLTAHSSLLKVSYFLLFNCYLLFTVRKKIYVFLRIKIKTPGFDSYSFVALYTRVCETRREYRNLLPSHLSAFKMLRVCVLCFELSTITRAYVVVSNVDRLEVEKLVTKKGSLKPLERETYFKCIV